MNTKNKEIVGLIPAAGKASRIGPIPCSKEIFPIGFKGDSDSGTVKVAAAYLLESFAKAKVSQIFMIIRKGKWDIPQYLGMGYQLGYPLAYIISEPTPGTHYTIDLAYHFVKDKLVLLGFSDILFRPKNAFTLLLEKQEKNGAEIVLGLFKTGSPQKADMVEVDKKGRIKNIVIKPDETNLEYCWTMAVWTPAFTRYLHQFITRDRNNSYDDSGGEVYIGHVIRQAMEDGLTIEAVTFADGSFVDIGTIPDLRKVMNDDF